MVFKRGENRSQRKWFPLVGEVVEAMKTRITVNNSCRYFTSKACSFIAPFLDRQNLSIYLVSNRKTKLGDYRHDFKRKNHIITLNEGLNADALLFIFLHEYAHYLTFEAYHHKRVPPHGKDWKNHFSILLYEAIDNQAFGSEISSQVSVHAANPKATLHADINLLKAFGLQNEERGTVALNTLPMGSYFLYKNKEFVKKKKNRTRYTCYCKTNRKLYTFHSLTPVFG